MSKGSQLRSSAVVEGFDFFRMVAGVHNGSSRTPFHQGFGRSQRDFLSDRKEYSVYRDFIGNITYDETTTF